MLFDIVDKAEITTSIHIIKESTSTCRKFDSQELLPVTISMTHDDDKSWFDAHKDFDSWCNTSETIDNYKEWYKLPNIHKDIGINNESTNKHIEPDLYISKSQT